MKPLRAVVRRSAPLLVGGLLAQSAAAFQFGPEQPLVPTVDHPNELWAADLDNDGDADVLSASFVDDKIAWYDNGRCSLTAPSSEVVRLGSPPNPAAFLPGVTSGPTICSTWDPVIDHTAFLPTAVLDVAILFGAPLNVPIDFPADCTLVGAAACGQGASIDAGGTIQLTNALDIVIGTF